MSEERPTDVAALAALVREASGGLRIMGAGTWMDAGHPVRATTLLRLDAFTGVPSYTPGDLTISVGAATTWAELDAVTAAHGQWCPLLPWGDDRGTVGATIATATSGPCADALGRPRDAVLGLECVDGRGRIVQAGGRVVKNVAGFDLTRLMTGSWGTLGVITHLHLRLRARPAVDRSVVVQPHDAAALATFLRGPLAPIAAVMVDEGWLLRLAGNAMQVAAAERALRAIGPCTEVPPATWDDVRRTRAPRDRAKDWAWTPLALRVRHAFDPRGILNPGLLGEPSGPTAARDGAAA